MAKRPQGQMHADRVMAALIEQASAERSWQYQGGREPVDVEDRPRPLEFDASGFPVAQRRPGFARRVGRLIGGS